MQDNVMKRVFNDMLLGEQVTTGAERVDWKEEVNPETGKTELTQQRRIVQVIDYNYYINYFALCLIMTEFAAWLKKLAHGENAEGVYPPAEGEVHVFGG